MQKDLKRAPLLLLCLSLSSYVHAACRAVPGADTVLWKQHVAIVWVGEPHGTAQTPAAFGDLVCDALAHAKTVTVGLELSSQLQPMVDLLLSASDPATAERALLSSPEWSNIVDGRSSEAMLALLFELRVLRANYPALRVVAIEKPWQNTPGEKDRVLAEEANSLITNRPGHVVLILTGNLHGMKQSPMPYKTAAMLLPSQDVFSLIVVSKGGMAWQATDKGCGAQAGGTRDKVTDRAFGIYKDGSYAKYGIDGVLALGEPTTASNPANMDAAGASQCYKMFQAQASEQQH